MSLSGDVLKILKSFSGLATRKQLDNRLDILTCYLQQSLRSFHEEQSEQRKFLERILAAVEPLPAFKILFDVELEGQITEGVESTEMTNSQQATATIQPVDVKGNPAAVDGVPVWASSDATIGTVTPAADGMSAVVAAVGPLGSFDVSVSGDADLGPGVAPIFGKLSVSVTPGQAVGFNIVLGPATEQGSGVPIPPVAPANP